MSLLRYNFRDKPFVGEAHRFPRIAALRAPPTLALLLLCF